MIPIYYMEPASGINFVPTEYVDITDVYEIKEAMFVCHESQVKWLMDHDKVDTVEKMRIFARYRGYQCGVTYAEGFRFCYADGRLPTKRFLP